MDLDLPPKLSALAAGQDGVFTRAQAVSNGMSPDEFRRRVSRRQWHRVRRGAYVPVQTWDSAGQAGRQRLGLRALTLQAQGPVIGSHDTAAAVLGLELWEPCFDWLHLTRPGRSARREARVWHHSSSLERAEVITVGDLMVTAALRTALDIARRSDFEHGLVAVDSALRLSHPPVDDLLAAHLRCTDWPGALTAGRAVCHADARAGSVGESRLRARLLFAGLPEPLSQVSVYDERQRLIGVVDFVLAGKTILEFDGQAKYGLHGPTPEALARKLWREKGREDALRRLGYEVVRFTWADLYHVERMLSAVRAALARAAASPPVRGSSAQEPLRYDATVRPRPSGAAAS